MLVNFWLSVVSEGLVISYWSSAWFVKTRKSSFVRHRRDEDEDRALEGNWLVIRQKRFCVRNRGYTPNAEPQSLHGQAVTKMNAFYPMPRNREKRGALSLK